MHEKLEGILREMLGEARIRGFVSSSSAGNLGLQNVNTREYPWSKRTFAGFRIEQTGNENLPYFCSSSYQRVRLYTTKYKRNNSP